MDSRWAVHQICLAVICKVCVRYSLQAKLVPLRPYIELGFEWTVSESISYTRRPAHFDQQLNKGTLQVNPSVCSLRS